MNILPWPIKGASLATVLLVYGPTLRIVESAQAAGLASRVHGWAMSDILKNVPPGGRTLARQIILEQAGLSE